MARSTQEYDIKSIHLDGILDSLMASIPRGLAISNVYCCVRPSFVLARKVGCLDTSK